ncbi:chalcone--flavanone isomerase-like [Telopea speciosissima]|uniref:chalcone--flavanone isomerase-like n=1 Tax=Telopea speciosissima TaxID=54955 RepID=UPI001CC6219C|nr:chalcone--flavanone isomerase-like [Telopea speciosissima]
MAPESVMVSELQVQDVTFPVSVKPLGSTKSLFLGGAGVRGLDIQGQFIKFTAIGIYLAPEALPSLAAKWKGKTTDELISSHDFFTDLVWGEFEKFIRVTFIKTLTGQEFTKKVTENCVAYWKEVETYSDVEAKVVEEFKDAFKDETFPPGASVLYTISPTGSLTVRSFLSFFLLSCCMTSDLQHACACSQNRVRFLCTYQLMIHSREENFTLNTLLT